MYSILGLKKFLWYCGLFAALVAVVHLSLTIHRISLRSDVPRFLHHLWNSAATGISACLAVVAAGDTKLFAFLCRKTCLGRMFPPIEGVWTGSLVSNIKVIAERDLALAEYVTTDTVQAEILIKARLLSVTVALRSRKLTSTRWYQSLFDRINQLRVVRGQGSERCGLTKRGRDTRTMVGATRAT